MLWQRPPHVSGGAPEVDDGLLRALLTARASAEWDRWYEAIVSFNLANTDHPKMSATIEAVLVVGALQRLLNCRGSDVNELCERFNQLFRPTERKTVASCGVSSPDPGVTERFRRAESVSDGWLRDFYALRGNLAHGMTTPRYPSVWNVHEHLLLSAFLFPRLVKLALAEGLIYALTGTDEADIDLFEELACERHLVEGNSPEEHRWPWTRIRSPMRIALKEAVRKAAERLR